MQSVVSISVLIRIYMYLSASGVNIQAVFHTNTACRQNGGHTDNVTQRKNERIAT